MDEACKSEGSGLSIGVWAMRAGEADTIFWRDYDWGGMADSLNHCRNGLKRLKPNNEVCEYRQEQDPRYHERPDELIIMIRISSSNHRDTSLVYDIAVNQNSNANDRIGDGEFFGGSVSCSIKQG